MISYLMCDASHGGEKNLHSLNYFCFIKLFSYQVFVRDRWENVDKIITVFRESCEVHGLWLCMVIFV